MANRGNFLKSVFALSAVPNVAQVTKFFPLSHQRDTHVCLHKWCKHPFIEFAELYTDSNGRRRINIKINEEIGISIVNPQGIAKITVN